MAWPSNDLITLCVDISSATWAKISNLKTCPQQSSQFDINTNGECFCFLFWDWNRMVIARNAPRYCDICCGAIANYMCGTHCVRNRDQVYARIYSTLTRDRCVTSEFHNIVWSKCTFRGNWLIRKENKFKLLANMGGKKCKYSSRFTKMKWFDSIWYARKMRKIMCSPRLRWRFTAKY